MPAKRDYQKEIKSLQNEIKNTKEQLRLSIELNEAYKTILSNQNNKYWPYWPYWYCQQTYTGSTYTNDHILKMPGTSSSDSNTGV